MFSYSVNECSMLTDAFFVLLDNSDLISCTVVEENRYDCLYTPLIARKRLYQ